MPQPRLRLFIIFFAILLAADLVPIQGALSTRPASPEFDTIKKWVGANTSATKKNLKGNVVILSFFSPTDSQSLWELNLLGEWYKTYAPSAPFQVIGVAVPEFEFQKNAQTFESAILKLKLPFPVGLDFDQSLYRAYGARIVPSHFILDPNGNIRHQYAGRFSYFEMEEKFRAILPETPSHANIPSIEHTLIPTFPGHTDLYLGYKKIQGLGNTEKLKAQTRQNFSSPQTLSPFLAYLDGQWIPNEEYIASASAAASLKISFSSFHAGIVAGTQKKGVLPAEVKIDGRPLSKEEKGKDIVFQEGRSYLLIKEYRFYKLVNTKYKSGFRTLEIIFEEPGAEIYKAGFN